MPSRRRIPLFLVLLAAPLACGGGLADSVDGSASADSANTADTAGTADTTSAAGTADAGDPPPEALAVGGVEPALVDPAGGSILVVHGAGFDGSIAVEIGGVPASVLEVLGPGEARIQSPAIDDAEATTLTIRRGADVAAWDGALAVWSPIEIPGARVFDAGHGVTVGAAEARYEWQRLTPTIDEAWRVRDGNTLTWLPSRGRYVMVGGWNGDPYPDGFNTQAPDVYPFENTTDEVWSSADGVTWTLDLPHGNGQFERRHAHNTVLWNDRLWMIGGDYHQGKYNHDVVSSADGLTWKVELGPGAADPPPWSERALQFSGVYDGKLWTAGGQDLFGDQDLLAHHNDVWNTEDGVHWNQVAADAPASDTRWAGCAAVDGLVEFHGRLWLVGCARYRDDVVGHTMSNEVWSTTDGVTWTRHADPPWKGKIWHNVVVWRDHLWVLFGFTYGDPDLGLAVGNANEVWYSPDGETWRALPFDAPVPGSHAQGVAVTDASILYAGGNYSFGFGAGVDKSAWRLWPMEGEAVTQWSDRGGLGLRARPPVDTTPPLRVADAFGPGAAGLVFDGSTSLLALVDDEGVETPDPIEGGLSIFWAARAPFSPSTLGWVEGYNPSSTVVGGTWPPSAAAGFTDGALSYVYQESPLGMDGPTWGVIHAGEGLQEGPGEARLAGLIHAGDGTLSALVDGVAEVIGAAEFGASRSWSRIGAGLDGAGEGAVNRFTGTIAAVVVTPGEPSADDLARLHAWAQGRFGVP